MSKTFILLIFTIFILIAVFNQLNLYARKNIINKYNLYLKQNDYTKAIELIEGTKRILPMYENVYLQSYLYFLANDYDKYVNIKRKYKTLNPKTYDEFELKLIYMFKLTENIYMYLHEEIDEANKKYQEFVTDKKEIEKMLFYLDHKINILFNILNVQYAFYSNDYLKAKEIYEYTSPYLFDKSTKTIISKYICMIYEIEGNKEKIYSIISNIDTQVNPYDHFLDSWRKK